VRYKGQLLPLPTLVPQDIRLVFASKACCKAMRVLSRGSVYL